MVTITRAEAKTAIAHILNNVLGQNDKSNLKLALLEEGIQDIFDLSTINDAVVDELQYEETASWNTFIPCNKGDKMLIKCFLNDEAYIGENGFDGDYTAITQESFDQFRISPNSKTSRVPPTSTSTQSLSLLHHMIHHLLKCSVERSELIHLSFQY
jgi:hypothetical protein